MTKYKKHPQYSLMIGDDGTVIGPQGKVLKNRMNNCGYARVVVYVEGKAKPVSVHRLVADTYLGTPMECVNHIDGNKLNNHPKNLEWCTNSANVKHAYASGLIDTKKHSRTLIESGSLQGVKHPNAKLNDEIVREIRLAPKTTYGSKPWVKYGISDVTYQQVQSMKVWRHVI